MTETGILTAFDRALTISPASFGLLRSADPYSEQTTFLAGHPMLMSIPSTPAASSFLPAFAKNSGSFPNSWIIIGRSIFWNSSIFSVFWDPCSIAFIEVSSEKHITSGVIAFTICRYGESVYPAIGARHTKGVGVFFQENFFIGFILTPGSKKLQVQKFLSGDKSIN